jgi:MHS family proline/betaine transporter-like MFS transporter
MGIFLRLKAKKPQDSIRIAKIHILKEIYAHRWAFLAIIFASGFSYTTYSLAFTFMNGYIPLVTTFTKVDVMKINTALLGLELILLPIFGLIANKFGKEKVMLLGVMILCVFALPLFAHLGSSSTLFSIVILRLVIVLAGLAFAAPYHAWAMEQVPVHGRATLLCLGYTLGSQLIGTPTASICIYAYKQTGWVGAPVLYLLPIALGALFSLWIIQKQKILQSL